MQRISITNPQNIIDGTAKKYYFKLRNTGGPKGDKGDKGDTGSRGPQGEPGNAATVYVGSTTTLPVGQDATVENVGTQYNAVLNFGIPQGPRGPQGVKGDPGEPGQKGEPGPRGIQGERGTNATVYVGTTSTLNPGSQARVYNSGTDSNAVLNFEIPRGDVGPMPTIAQTTGQSTTEVMSQKATTDALNTKQATISSSNKLSADLVTDTSTTNKFVTAEDKTTWNAKQNALTAGQGIDITSDVISTPALVPEVVASLPAEGTEGKLYLTPKAHTTQTATGNPITASVTEQAGAIESFQLDGDTTQQTYSGAQLVKEQGFATPASNTDFWQISNATQSDISSDGFSTFTFSGTSFKNFFIKRAGSDIKASTTYTIIIELDKVSDVPFMTVTQGNTGSDSFPDFTPISLPDGASMYSSGYATYGAVTMTAGNGGNIVLLGTTRDELKTQTLRFFTSGAGSDGKKIRARVSIIEGDHSSDWQNYCGDNWQPYVGGVASPNPDYPRPIQTVTGEQTVTVLGKNLSPNIRALAWTSNNISNRVIRDNEMTYTLSTGASYSGVYLNKINNYDICDYYYKSGYIVSFEVSASTQTNFIVGQSGGTQSSYTVGTTPVRISATTGDANFVFYAIDKNGASVTIKNIQLEAGSTATAYAPYSKQTYPINLGKNLFDKNNATISHFYPHVSEIRQNDSAVSIVLPVEAGTTYTASTTNRSLLDSTPAVACTDHLVTSAPDSFLSRTQWGSGDSVSFTAPAGAKYMYIYVKWTTDATAIANILATIQVEKGSQATTYAPYFTPIELCKLGTYQDYIYKDGDSWKVHKDTGKYTFDGSESWVYDTARIPRLYLTSVGLLNLGIHAAIPGSSTVMPAGISNKFVAKTFTDFYNNSGGNGFAMSTTGQNFQVGKNSWTSEDGAKADIVGTVWYYGLATGYITDTVITDTNLIAQLEAIRTASLENGANTITNTATGSNLAGDMEIGYYGYNPRNRYDKWLWLDINNEYEQIGS